MKIFVTVMSLLLLIEAGCSAAKYIAGVGIVQTPTHFATNSYFCFFLGLWALYLVYST